MLFLACGLLLLASAPQARPEYTTGRWTDTFEDNHLITSSDRAVLSGNGMRLRGELSNLGRVSTTTLYTSALIHASDGIIYGGTAMPGNLYTYDPAGPAWNPGTEAGCNPRVLGIPVIDDWRPGTEMNLRDLLEGPDGMIYGCIYYWETAYAEECRQKGGRVFVYDPTLPWNPGTGTSGNPRDLGQAIAGENAVNSLCMGNDGWVYGGTYADSPAAAPAPPESGGRLFRLDPATVWDTTPVVQDLGKADPDIDEAWGVVAHPDAVQDVIYMCTGNEARLFSYDVGGASFTDLGRLGSEVSFSDLVIGPDGRIYLGSYPTCRLAVYDPSHPETGIVDKGPVLENQRELSALVAGPDGLVYLGTYGHSRGDWFDGSLLAYDPATDTLENLGPPEEDYLWVNRLCAFTQGSDTVVYGAGLNNVFFRFSSAARYDDTASLKSDAVYPQAPVLGQLTIPPNTGNASQRVSAIAAAAGGDVYAGTYVDWPNEPEISTVTGGHLFRYRPGVLGLGDLTDLGQPLPGEYGLTSLAEGADGAIYIGTHPSAHLVRYRPSTGTYEDLGQPRAGEQTITSLVSRGRRIYGGTYPGGRLFYYDLDSGETVALGMPVSARSEVTALTLGRDGLVYGTAGVGAALFAYDPGRAWSPGTGPQDNPRELAALGSESFAAGLACGADGRVYAGTSPGGYVFVYDPSSGSLGQEDPGTGKGIHTACPGSDGKVYLGTTSQNDYSLDHELLVRYEDGSYRRLPCVGGWERKVSALALGENGRIYAGTSLFGYLLEYEPGYFFDWDAVEYGATTPASTTLSVDLLDAVSGTVRTGVASGADISGIDPASFPALRLRAGLSTTDALVTPELTDWGLTWTPGGDAPATTSLSDSEGWYGMEVTVNGSGFGAEKGSSHVDFNGHAALEYVSWSDGVIVVRVPPWCGDGPVTVTTMCGTSAGEPFTIIPGPLDHFTFAAIAGQQAGVAFSVTLSARDAYDNLVEGFTGTVALSASVGDVSPAASGSFTAGTWTGDLTLYQADPAVHLTAAGAGKSGTSADFAVGPGPLDHFTFAAIGGQQAGVAFSVTLSARDAYDNLVEGFTGTVALSASVGDVSPAASGSFTAGTWTGDLTLYQADPAVHLTAAGAGKSGTSADFAVDPGPLDHFTFEPISGQQAGVAFSVTLSARDAYDNLVEGFTGTVALSASVGDVSPAASGSFTAGTWTGDLTLYQADPAVHLTAAGAGESGTSADFAVDPGPLDHFTFAAISGQQAGVAFSVTLSARDAYDNLVEGFTGTVALSDLSGSLSPTSTTAFQAGAWSGQVSVEDPWDGDRIEADHLGAGGASGYFDVRGEPEPPVEEWYFAEGYTGDGFEEWLCLANFSATDATVTVTYYYEDAAPLTKEPFILPAGTRRTLYVNAEAGAGRNVSARVASTAPIVAERPIYFNYRGAWTGGSDVIGAREGSTDACFAEGYTGEGFEEWLCLANFSDTDATVTVTYYYEDAAPLTKEPFTLPAGTRRTLYVNAEAGAGRNVSARVASTAPIVAERPIYFNYRGAWTGGSDVIGAREGSTDACFAEGYTGEGFEEWLCLANFSATDATVTVTYYYEDAAPLTKEPFILPAGTRRTLYVNAEAGAGRNVSARVASTAPIVAERPIYFNYRGAWTGGSDVIGAREGSTDACFAEGYTGDGFEEWLCLANFWATDATVTVTYYYEDAAPLTKEPFTLPAGSRRTLYVNAEAGAGRNVSPGWPPPPPSWPSAPSTSTTAAPGPAAPTSSATDRRLPTGARHRRRRQHY